MKSGEAAEEEEEMVATFHLVPRNATLRAEILSNDLPWPEQDEAWRG